MSLYSTINGAGSFSVEFYGGNGFRTASGLFANGTWVHMAAVKTPGAINANTTLYLNAVSQSAVSPSTNTPNVTAGAPWVGADGTTFANVIIADAAIWNTNLSSGQITQLFNGVRPINVNSANLKVWYPCDGFSNSTENDLSGNSNTGTVTGALPILGPPYTWRLG
jgi:hypothetical protein